MLADELIVTSIQLRVSSSITTLQTPQSTCLERNLFAANAAFHARSWMSTIAGQDSREQPRSPRLHR